MYRNQITAFIDQQQIVSVLNSKFTHGLCGLGSSYDQNLFDNFSVKKGAKTTIHFTKAESFSKKF